jgi:glycosyltransferase involved in cell wall biosynthesis
MESLVSIIVPTYNREWLLPRTLHSLVNQSYQNIEIILVNDAGEDVQAVVDQIGDSRITYHQNEKNLGLAGARNIGLAYSDGDYICLLDDDDIFLPYTIEFRMHMMEKLGAEIVYSRALRDVWEKAGEPHQYRSVAKQLYWDSPFNKDLILIQNIAPCCCPLFSRKAWQDSDFYFFDETLTTTEDHDFWISLSRHNNFHELKLVDCECSYRTEKGGQMTGTLDFSPNWIRVFKKWRHTAIDLGEVVKSQNNILRRAGINPEDHGL